MMRWVVGSILHGGPIELFLVPASAPRLVWQRPRYVLSCLWESLLLIGKSSPCGGSGFPLSLSEWSFTICLTRYNRKYNVLSASLNKTFPSFLPLEPCFPNVRRARCSSVITAFDHGAMGRRIDPSWWTQCAISCSSQCSVVCVILFVEWCSLIIKGAIQVILYISDLYYIFFNLFLLILCQSGWGINILEILRWGCQKNN